MRTVPLRGILKTREWETRPDSKLHAVRWETRKKGSLAALRMSSASDQSLPTVQLTVRQTPVTSSEWRLLADEGPLTTFYYFFLDLFNVCFVWDEAGVAPSLLVHFILSNTHWTTCVHAFIDA